MRNFAKITFVALAMAVVPLAYTQAQTSVQFDFGNVAIGYSDGYWDRTHQWHAWERAEHREAYRAAKNAEFHEWKHDRDADKGWHERKW